MHQVQRICVVAGVIAFSVVFLAQRIPSESYVQVAPASTDVLAASFPMLQMRHICVVACSRSPCTAMRGTGLAPPHRPPQCGKCGILSICMAAYSGTPHPQPRCGRQNFCARSSLQCARCDIHAQSRLLGLPTTAMMRQAQRLGTVLSNALNAACMRDRVLREPFQQPRSGRPGVSARSIPKRRLRHICAVASSRFPHSHDAAGLASPYGPLQCAKCGIYVWSHLPAPPSSQP